jgi:RNA polymerase sigma-70 factor (ECF subfamily)
LQRSEQAQTQAQGDLRRWLFSILHSMWWKDMRPHQRRRVRPIKQEPAAAGPRAFPLHPQAIAQVDALPDELRSVMLLVVVEGFACWEAAEILAIPVDTVKHRLARARIDIGMRLLEARGEEGAQDTRSVVTSMPIKRASR